jgi:hypothetical protein
VTRWKTADGGHAFGREHTWLPCAVAEDLDGKSGEEIAAIYRAHRWMDLITNAEWPVLLQRVRNAPVKSRLKRKLTWWLMALGRVAEIQPDLYDQAATDAKALFEQQFGRPHPLYRAPGVDEDGV